MMIIHDYHVNYMWLEPKITLHQTYPNKARPGYILAMIPGYDQA